MTADSTLLPNVDEPPGAAASSGDGTGTAFNYSPHLNRIVTALEQLSISMALIAENTQDISDNLQNRIVPAVETIAAQQSIIAIKQTAIETYQKKIKELSEGEGVHMVGPWEWLSMYAIYKLLVTEGVTDFASLKAQVDALPKQPGF